MKVIAAVLAVVAVATAQTFNTDVQNGWALIGYPNNFEVAKAGGESYGFFNIDPQILPNVMPGDGRRACFKVMGKITSPAGGNTAWYGAPYTQGEGTAPRPTITDFHFDMDLTASAKSKTYNWDITPTTNSTPTAYAWPRGIAVLAAVGNCALCSKTTELTVSAVIGWCTGAGCCTATTPAITWTPFLAVDDRNTWTFDASPATGYQSPSIIIPASRTSQPVFFFIQPDRATDSVTLVVHKQAVPRPADPAGVSSQTADVKVLPLGARRNGNFRSGAVTLENAAWVAEAYVNGGNSWTIAFGFGHEPAAAAGLVPSFLLAALLAVVALLL